ncbi:MAG: hypothetical protein Q7S40_23240 [Opitutaceae bacterium]|nr:hypothetical protein [Opitutaceae bacterium]
MKKTEFSFKIVALVIIAGVIVAFAAPSDAKPPSAPAAKTATGVATASAVHASE